jgi:hypothetical protein
MLLKFCTFDAMFLLSFFSFSYGITSSNRTVKLKTKPGPGYLSIKQPLFNTKPGQQHKLVNLLNIDYFTLIQRTPGRKVSKNFMA